MRLTDEIIAKLSRNELIANLNKAKDCIRELEKFEAEHNSVMNEINKIKEKKKEIEEGEGAGGCLLYFVILICAGGVFAGLGDGEMMQVIICFIVGVLSIFVIKYKNNVYYSHEQERKQQAEMYYNETYPPLEEKKQEIEKRLNNFLETEKYQNARLLVPKHYFDRQSILSISMILENRRALTMTDAINVYESDLHKMRLEEAAQRSANAAEAQVGYVKDIARATEEQALYTRDIARNTKSTARAAQLNAFINFVKK